MSISQNFPAISPSLSLNFARSKTLDPRITFARPSTLGDPTYMNENGLIVTAAADEPRFDHKYENGVIKSLGLLVEEQRTNLFTQSIISNWGNPVNGTKTANDGLSPDNTNTATLLEATEIDSQTRIENHGGRIPGTTYTQSCFCKAGTTHYCTFGLYETTVPPKNFQAIFDLTGEGTVTREINCTATIIPFPNGWYKCSMTITLTARELYSGSGWKLGVCNSPTEPHHAEIGDNVYFWGAQLEVGSFPTSYIPTSGGTKTRSPDNVSITGTNFSDWYNQSEGTIFLDCTPVYNNSTNQYRRFLSIHNNSGAQVDVIQFIQSEQSNKVLCAVWDEGNPQSGFGKVVTSGTRYKVAFAVKENNMNACYDGNIGTDDDDCTLPAMTQMDIGSYNTFSSTQATMHINKISYYPRRLTNEQLQNLTK